MTIALIKQAKAGADIICGQIVSKKHIFFGIKK